MGEGDALVPGGPEQSVEPVVELGDDIVSPGTFDRSFDRCPVLDACDVADADRGLHLVLELEEVLESPCQAGPPGVGRDPREVRVVDRDPAGGRVVELRQKLDEAGLSGAVLPYDSDHGTGGKVERDVGEDFPVGSGVTEADALQADAPAKSVGHRLVRIHDASLRKVLQPYQAPRTVQPDRAEEVGLPDRLPEVLRQAAARRQNEEYLTRGGAAALRRDENHAKHERGAEHCVRRRLPDRRRPSRARKGYVAPRPCRHCLLSQPLLDPRDPYLLSRPGGGAEEEQAPGTALVLGAGLLDPLLDAGAPIRRQHGRDGEHAEQPEKGMYRHQQRQGDPQAQQCTRDREQHLVQLAERGAVVPQQGETVHVVGAFVVLDGGD